MPIKGGHLFEAGCLLHYQFHKEVSLFCKRTITKNKIINGDVPRQNLNMILQFKLGAAFSQAIRQSKILEILSQLRNNNQYSSWSSCVL